MNVNLFFSLEIGCMVGLVISLCKCPPLLPLSFLFGGLMFIICIIALALADS